MTRKSLLKGTMRLLDFKSGGPWWHVPIGFAIGFALVLLGAWLDRPL